MGTRNYLAPRFIKPLVRPFWRSVVPVALKTMLGLIFVMSRNTTMRFLLMTGRI